MTYGLKQAGIEVLAGVDIDAKCKETYEHNNFPAKFIEADLEDLTPLSLEAGIKFDDGSEVKIKRNDDDLLFVGCSPCQYWSIINTDRTKSENSKNLLEDFQKFVEYFNPGYVIIENVPGIFSKSDSPLRGFIAFLEEKGYFVDSDIIKVSEYGVPQTRKRFVLIASRVKKISIPDPVEDKSLTVRNFIGDENNFPKLKEGHKDDSDLCHTTAGLSVVNLQRLDLTEIDGGTREGWQDTDLQLPVYEKNRNNKKFRFGEIYGRMFWDKPAPTITTRFYSLSNGRFGHPEQNRAISLREGATLQTFPLDYAFKATTITDISRIIGNAVPPELARRIGEAILETSPQKKVVELFDGI